MRVLIAVPRLAMPGGVANYYKTLRPYLDEQKVYFEIGSLPDEKSQWAKLCRSVRDFWSFHRLLSTSSFDLVHLNPSIRPYALLRDGLLLLIARLHRRIVLVYYRGWHPGVEASVRKNYPRLFRFVYGRAAASVVLAEEFRDTLAELGLRMPIYIETTVVDDAVFAGEAAAQAPDTRSGTAGESGRILYLGRLDKGKGLPEAIEAFARLQQRWPEATLTVAGDGPERAVVERDVQQRGLRGVRFLGHVTGNAKSDTFRQADIYLFTSLAEGMPNSVLEAMAFGLPVVTSLVGGIRDFFEDDRMGYATDSLDAEVYAELLNRLVSDPALCHKIGQYNRDYARQRFSASVVAARLQAIYAQVVMAQQ